jgi:hypothetical protein
MLCLGGLFLIPCVPRPFLFRTIALLCIAHDYDYLPLITSFPFCFHFRCALTMCSYGEEGYENIYPHEKDVPSCSMSFNNNRLLDVDVSGETYRHEYVHAIRPDT